MGEGQEESLKGWDRGWTQREGVDKQGDRGRRRRQRWGDIRGGGEGETEDRERGGLKGEEERRKQEEDIHGTEGGRKADMRGG